MLTARSDANGFINLKNTWLFIDLVDENKNTALQILWRWAQQCGSRLAISAGNFEMEKSLKQKSVIVQQLLMNTA